MLENYLSWPHTKQQWKLWFHKLWIKLWVVLKYEGVCEKLDPNRWRRFWLLIRTSSVHYRGCCPSENTENKGQWMKGLVLLVKKCFLANVWSNPHLSSQSPESFQAQPSLIFTTDTQSCSFLRLITVIFLMLTLYINPLKNNVPLALWLEGLCIF